MPSVAPKRRLFGGARSVGGRADGRVLSGGCSSVGRAPGLQPGGHRFDPVHLHQLSPLGGRCGAKVVRRSPRSRGRKPQGEGGLKSDFRLFDAWGAPLRGPGSLKTDSRMRPKDVHALSSGQVNKGARWMPWRQEAMKDVAGCDKLR